MSEQSFFDRYILEERLGEGGMGEVWKAFDQKLGCAVAIKLMNPKVASSIEFRKRFSREAFLAAQLRDCPNICFVLDHDVAEGNQPFISMEFLEGKDLKERIQEASPFELPPTERQTFGFRERLRVIEHACYGLARAHEVNVLHRDIKPANIFITLQNQVKVLDFGVAKIRDSTLTAESTTVGTIPYMSPEQLQGRPVDVRTDIWSMGVVLYEIISSRKPFQGDQGSTSGEIVSEAHPALTQYLPALPRELERIVDHALAKDPEQRTATADDLIRSLQRFYRLLDTKEHELLSEIQQLEEQLRQWRCGVSDAQVPVILDGCVFTSEADPDQTRQDADYGTLLERHSELFHWWNLIRENPDGVPPVFDLFSRAIQMFDSGSIQSCFHVLEEIKALDSANVTCQMLEVECDWLLDQPSSQRKKLVKEKVRHWRARQKKGPAALKAKRTTKEGKDCPNVEASLAPPEPAPEVGPTALAYSFTTPVSDPRMLKGRRKEMDEIIAGVRLGESYAVVGGTRMGKTSLLFEVKRVLIEELKKDSGCVVGPVFLNTHQFPKLSQRAIYRQVIHEFKTTVCPSRFPRLIPRLKDIERELFDQGTMEEEAFPVFVQALANIVKAVSEDLRIVIMIDELDELQQYDWSKSFFNNLRHLISISDLRRNVAMVISGTLAIYSLYKVAGSPFLNVISGTKTLRTLSRAEAEDLINEPTDRRIDQPVIDQVLRETGGHPFLVQYLMKNLCDQFHTDLKAITAEDVSQVVEKFLDEREDCKTWSSKFSDAAKEAYKIIASDPIGLRKFQLVQQLGDAEEANTALELLVHTGVVREAERNHYVLAGEIFKTWFQENVSPLGG